MASLLQLAQALPQLRPGQLDHPAPARLRRHTGNSYHALAAHQHPFLLAHQLTWCLHGAQLAFVDQAEAIRQTLDIMQYVRCQKDRTALLSVFRKNIHYIAPADRIKPG